MNTFDTELLTILNQLSQRSWAADTTANFISGNHFVKGGVLLAFFDGHGSEKITTNPLSECV